MTWPPSGEVNPRVGFIVSSPSRPAERLVAFHNQRGTAEQYIEEGKNAIRWTRLSCGKFDHNAVRLQPHALACNLGNFMRNLVRWSSCGFLRTAEAASDLPFRVSEGALAQTSTPSSSKTVRVVDTSASLSLFTTSTVPSAGR